MPAPVQTAFTILWMNLVSHGNGQSLFGALFLALLQSCGREFHLLPVCRIKYMFPLYGLAFAPFPCLPLSPYVRRHGEQ